MAEELQEELTEELLEQQDEDTQKGRFMNFPIGKECFGISISFVNEIISMQPITPLPEVEHYIKGLLNLRGKIIPIIDVRLRFGMEPLEYTDRTCIIVINVKETVIGLVVEKMAEVITINEDDIMPPPTLSRRDSEQSKKYVYGIARAGDKVVLLIEPNKLINDEDMKALEAASEEEK